MNGGISWIVSQSPTSNHYYGVDFVDGRTGWTVGSTGTVIRTTDGGTNWSLQSAPVTNNLYDVCFVNANLGLAVGDSGTILHTTNSGGLWSKVNSGTMLDLRGMKMVDTANAWIVGAAGTILRSTDGGATWQPQISNISTRLYSVCFLDSQNGWAVGHGPAITKTTNGGSTWIPVFLPEELALSLRGVHFVDATHGWVIDYYGKVLKTIDGGQTWSQAYQVISGGWGPYFYKIAAVGSQHITFCGSRSNIVMSTDNGTTWINQTANLPPQFIHRTRNIVATIPGKVTPNKECVVVAHYDSYVSSLYYDPYVAAPGANDNATGTAAVMEAACICRGYQFESTIKFIAVSAEEFGMYGSEHFAYTAKAQGRNIVGAVNGDMLGYPTSGDTTRFVVGSYLNRNRLVDSAIVYNQRYNISANIIQVIDSTGASDYGPFALAGYDALDVAEATAEEIWGGMDPFYHTSHDSADKLNFGLVRRASQLMLATVAEMAIPIGKITTVESSPIIPKYFALQQNYPNPFNPVTTIIYWLAEESKVKLNVFDILGREIVTLIDDVQNPGNYAVKFDARNIPSGIYFCQLQAGKFIATIKMMLVK